MHRFTFAYVDDTTGENVTNHFALHEFMAHDEVSEKFFNFLSNVFGYDVRSPKVTVETIIADDFPALHPNDEFGF